MADLVLQTVQPLPAKVSVTIGNLTLQGSVYRQATFAGRTEARIVAGLGWSQGVQSRGYSNPGGVPTLQVLADAAAEVGESVNGATGTVGNQFVRFGDSPQMSSKAGRVLRSVAGKNWWVDNNGVTQIGPRPGGTVTSDFTVEEFRGAHQDLRIATEDPGSWAPGVTFSSATITQQTVSSVRHEFGQDGIARMWVTVGSSDGWLDAIRELIRQEVAASLPYAQVYEYQVAVAAGGQVSALPVDPSHGAPPISGLQVSGGVGTLNANGGKVLVGFLDGNPGKPYLAGNEGLFASFVENFLQWTPIPMDGGAALKLLITAWMTANGVLP